MQWTGIRRRRGPTSNWYQQESLDGMYLVRRAVSRYGEPTRIYALRRDERGGWSILIGDRFRTLEGAMAACRRDARSSTDELCRMA